MLITVEKKTTTTTHKQVEVSFPLYFKGDKSFIRVNADQTEVRLYEGFVTGSVSFLTIVSEKEISRYLSELTPSNEAEFLKAYVKIHEGIGKCLGAENLVQLAQNYSL